MGAPRDGSDGLYVRLLAAVDLLLDTQGIDTMIVAVDHLEANRTLLYVHQALKTLLPLARGAAAGLMN